MEVASQYQAHGTPMGYLIDEKGTIASNLAAGAPALLALASAGSATAEERKAQQKPKGKGNKPLSESRLNRSGLKAGTPAPMFLLARLEGGDLALEEYRGRQVLLVFSDSQWFPCAQPAPDSWRLHPARRSRHVP